MSQLVEVVIARADEAPAGEVAVAGAFEGEAPPAAGGGDGDGNGDPRTAAALARLAGRPGFTGQAKQLASTLIDDGPVGAAELAGLGPRGELTARALGGWLDRTIERQQAARIGSVVWRLPDHPTARGEAAAERIVRRLALASYRFDRFKTDTEETAPTIERIVVVPPAGEEAAYRAAAEPARAAARGVALARDLANTPGNEAHPEWMEERARELAERHGLSIEVVAGDQLVERGMGGVVAVGQGSTRPPRLVRISTGSGGDRNGGRPSVALVGKGVTFDTGGISIKPAAAMDEMKYDKSGACTVLGVLEAAATLGLPVDLTAYLPFAENMPDGAAYRPGDIIRCYNGKTVEITNTDAEGRLILADALAWAVEEGPDAVLEFSTLTGACVVALGLTGAGLFTPDDGLAGELLAAAEAGGERLWRLPLWPEFLEEMRGNHADLKNSASRWGGASTAAAFLSSFVGDHPRWAHLDIAGPSHDPGKDGERACGATGYGVASTLNWLRGLPAVG